MAQVAGQHYRADGVRITHDPYAPGMAEKYGRPGETDQEGFDPYADSVGPGIYSGIVARDEQGQIIIGKQYQNHNPRPGPVYAGGGYTPVSKALRSPEALGALLDKFPDLVNDVATGGAQPLHSCGMSRAHEPQTALLISRGADIEAVDTYGFTPLMRMASNNLAEGSRALLAAGADPARRVGGRSGDNALAVAQSSQARDVIRALREHGATRADVGVARIVVGGAGVASVNGAYAATPAARVPAGFAKVCAESGWDTAAMWAKLGGGADWFDAEEGSGSYIYFNHADGHWWIDEPNGGGVYKAVAPPHAPPAVGWQLLGDYAPPPSYVAVFRALPTEE